MQEGYAYQDLIAGLIILNEFIEASDSYIKLEEKMIAGDKFDDIEVEIDGVKSKIQVKHSYAGIINLSTLSSGDLNLYEHFVSWMQLKDSIENFVVISNREIDLTYFCLLSEKGNLVKGDLYKLKQEQLIINGNINPKFKKLYTKFNESSYNINNFIEFISCLKFEILKKSASFEFKNTNDLEKHIIKILASKFGVGQYPLENITPHDFARRLIEKIRVTRFKSKSGLNNVRDIIQEICDLNDIPTLSHNFRVDNTEFVPREDTLNQIDNSIVAGNFTFIEGEPGCGKSWLLSRYENEDYDIIRYNFYEDVKDPNLELRATLNSFMYDIKHQLIDRQIVNRQHLDFMISTNVEEFYAIVKRINSNVLFLIDGLDHISRILNDSELQEVLKLIEDLPKGENVKIIIASQPLAFKFTNCVNIKVNRFSDIELDEYLEKFSLIGCKGRIKAVSGSNILYVNYIVKYLISKKSMGVNYDDALNELPLYSGNIEIYYKYLLSGLDEYNDNLIAYSVLDFSVSVSDISEIFGFKKEFGYILNSKLQPVLRENYYNEFCIYHESFKRYILEKYVTETYDVNVRIYYPLLRWFNKYITTSFFDNRKIYKHYFSISKLLDLYDEDFLDLILDDYFVEISCRKGYLPCNIRNNLSILLEHYSLKKDLGKIVLISELKNQVDGFINNMVDISDSYFNLIIAENPNNAYNIYNDYYDNGNGRRVETLYIALSMIKLGYHINFDEMLIDIEDRHNTYLRTKLEYVISFETLSKEYLINCDPKDIYAICTAIKNSGKINEYVSILENDSLDDNRSVLYGLHLSENLYNTYNYTQDVSDILESSMIYKDELIKIIKLSRTKGFNLEDFEYLAEGFYGSKLFYVIMAMSSSTSLTSSEALELLKLLKCKVSEIFKGKPRTVDFHNNYNVITGVVLRLIDITKDTEQFYDAIDVVMNYIPPFKKKYRNGVSNVSLYSIIDCLMELNSYEVNSILYDYLNKIIKSEDSYYTSLADMEYYLYKLSRLIKPEESVKHFESIINYHVAYTFHKDISFSNVTEYLGDVCSCNSINKTKKLDKLSNALELSKRLIKHTDGDETRYYHEEVLKEVYGLDVNIFMSYLIHNYIHFSNSFLFKRLLSNIFDEDVICEDRKSKLVYLLRKDNLSNIEYKDLVELFDVYGLNDFSTKEIVRKYTRISESYNEESNRIIEHYGFIYNFPSKVDEKPKSEIKETTHYIYKDGDNVVETFMNKYVSKNSYEAYISNIDKDSINSLMDEIQDKYYDTRIVNHNVDYFIEHIDLVKFDEETLIDFVVFISIFIRDGWYSLLAKYEYIKYAIEINCELSKEYFFKHINNAIERKYYNYKFSSSVLKAYKFFDENETMEIFDNLLSFYNIRIPGNDYEFKLTHKFNVNRSSLEYLLIFLILEMFEMNSKSINKNFAIIQYLMDNKVCENEIANAISFVLYNNNKKHYHIYRLLISFVIRNKIKLSNKCLNNRIYNDFLLDAYLNRSRKFKVESLLPENDNLTISEIYSVLSYSGSERFSFIGNLNEFKMYYENDLRQDVANDSDLQGNHPFSLKNESYFVQKYAEDKLNDILALYYRLYSMDCSVEEIVQMISYKFDELLFYETNKLSVRPKDEEYREVFSLIIECDEDFRRIKNLKRTIVFLSSADDAEVINKDNYAYFMDSYNLNTDYPTQSLFNRINKISFNEDDLNPIHIYDKVIDDLNNHVKQIYKVYLPVDQYERFCLGKIIINQEI